MGDAPTRFGVRRLRFVGQIIGAIHPVDRTWCCDRCREVSIATHLERVSALRTSGHAGRPVEGRGLADDEQ
jgi:hypothetical protein